MLYVTIKHCYKCSNLLVIGNNTCVGGGGAMVLSHLTLSHIERQSQG